jgi:hypothetical protein
MGGVADRDLALLHRLEQRRLHLGGRAVDLVGQDQVGEQRARFCVKGPGVHVVDRGAGDVGRQQIRRELDALEGGGDGLARGLDRQRLGQARHALDQAVAVGQEADQDPLDHLGLADHDLADLGDDVVEEPALALDLEVEIADRAVAAGRRQGRGHVGRRRRGGGERRRGDRPRRCHVDQGHGGGRVGRGIRSRRHGIDRRIHVARTMSRIWSRCTSVAVGCRPWPSPIRPSPWGPSTSRPTSCRWRRRR